MIPIIIDLVIGFALEKVQREHDELQRQALIIFQQELNQSGYDASHAAMLLTPRRTAAQVRAGLSAPATRVHNRTGKPPTIAEAIINKRRRLRGRPPLRGAEMRTAEEKFIKRKIIGAGYWAAGFLEAMKVFERFGVKTKPVPEDIVDFGLPDGDAIPAKIDKEQMSVTIINNSRGADPGAREALNTAMQTEGEEMLIRIQHRLEELWDKGGKSNN